MTTNEKHYKLALMRCAMQFKDISEVDLNCSEKNVLDVACTALGWKWSFNEFSEVTFPDHQISEYYG